MLPKDLIEVADTNSFRTELQSLLTAHGAEQESFLEQERFVQMEITFTLRKNGGYSMYSLYIKYLKMQSVAKAFIYVAN